jgi:hypothetical protein
MSKQQDKKQDVMAPDEEVKQEDRRPISAAGGDEGMN